MIKRLLADLHFNFMNIARVLASKCLKGGGYSYFNDEVLRLRGFFNSPWPFENNSEAF